MSSKESDKFGFEKLTPALLVITVGLAFVVGVLWQKVNTLETGGGTNVAGTEELSPENLSGKLDGDQASKLARVSGLSEEIEGSGDDTPQITGEDHIRGSKDAKVFIIEYSDLECPFCASFHPTAVQALEEYGGDVAWVYRHFPLDSIHANARPTANASECVTELGGNDAFWQFVDLTFENQATALSEEGMKNTASEIGLDAGAFANCLESEKYADKVEDHYQTGITAGVTGTPGNFVINKKGEVWVIPGAVPFETLKNTLDEALAS